MRRHAGRVRLADAPELPPARLRTRQAMSCRLAHVERRPGRPAPVLAAETAVRVSCHTRPCPPPFVRPSLGGGTPWEAKARLPVRRGMIRAHFPLRRRRGSPSPASRPRANAARRPDRPSAVPAGGRALCTACAGVPATTHTARFSRQVHVPIPGTVPPAEAPPCDAVRDGRRLGRGGARDFDAHPAGARPDHSSRHSSASPSQRGDPPPRQRSLRVLRAAERRRYNRRRRVGIPRPGSAACEGPTRSRASPSQGGGGGEHTHARASAGPPDRMRNARSAPAGA